MPLAAAAMPPITKAGKFLPPNSASSGPLTIATTICFHSRLTVLVEGLQAIVIAMIILKVAAMPT